MSTAPTVSTTRDQLRSQTGVQLVKAENEGFALLKQPAGTYGFTGAPLDACPVFARQSFQAFEVMKRPDGAQLLVCYVSPAHQALIASDQEPIEVRLYPEPFEQATLLIAVQFDRIIKKKQPSRIDGNYIDATLARL